MNNWADGVLAVVKLTGSLEDDPGTLMVRDDDHWYDPVNGEDWRDEDLRDVQRWTGSRGQPDVDCAACVTALVEIEARRDEAERVRDGVQALADQIERLSASSGLASGYEWGFIDARAAAAALVRAFLDEGEGRMSVGAREQWLREQLARKMDRLLLQNPTANRFWRAGIEDARSVIDGTIRAGVLDDP